MTDTPDEEHGQAAASADPSAIDHSAVESGGGRSRWKWFAASPLVVAVVSLVGALIGGAIAGLTSLQATTVQIRNDSALRLRDETRAGCAEVLRLAWDRGERLDNSAEAVKTFIAGHGHAKVQEDQIKIARDELKQYHVTDIAWDRAVATLLLTASSELEMTVGRFDHDANELASLIKAVNLPVSETRNKLLYEAEDELSTQGGLGFAARKILTICQIDIRFTRTLLMRLAG